MFYDDGVHTPTTIDLSRESLLFKRDEGTPCGDNEVDIEFSYRYDMTVRVYGGTIAQDLDLSQFLA